MDRALRLLLIQFLKIDPAPDSMKLKDGQLFISNIRVKNADSGHHKGKEHVFVTYSSDGKDNGKEVKEVTVYLLLIRHHFNEETWR